MSIHSLSFTPKQLNVINYLIGAEIEQLEEWYGYYEKVQEIDEYKDYIEDRLVTCKQIYSQLQKRL